jgi:hypothetical protein
VEILYGLTSTVLGDRDLEESAVVGAGVARVPTMDKIRS